MKWFSPWCLGVLVLLVPALTKAQNFQIRVQAYAANIDSTFELSQVPAIEFSLVADSSLVMYLHGIGTRRFAMRSIDSIIFNPDSANTTLTYLFASGTDSTYSIASIDSIVIPPVVTSGVAPAHTADGILGCYPNPSTGTIRIAFTLAEVERIHLELFDVAGTRVKDFGSEEYGAGSHTLTWNGLDDNDRPVSAGAYLLELSGDRTQESLNVVIAH